MEKKDDKLESFAAGKRTTEPHAADGWNPERSGTSGEQFNARLAAERAAAAQARRERNGR